jgi:hypothetical protein
MYPLIRVRIIYIGDEIPSLYADYSEYFTLFHAIDGISTVYTAQTVRILYPALLHDDDVDSFLIFRPLSCVGVNEIAICYKLYLRTKSAVQAIKFTVDPALMKGAAAAAAAAECLLCSS